jgi:hypothetical protein
MVIPDRRRQEHNAAKSLRPYIDACDGIVTRYCIISGSKLWPLLALLWRWRVGWRRGRPGHRGEHAGEQRNWHRGRERPGREGQEERFRFWASLDLGRQCIWGCGWWEDGLYFFSARWPYKLSMCLVYVLSVTCYNSSCLCMLRSDLTKSYSEFGSYPIHNMSQLVVLSMLHQRFLRGRICGTTHACGAPRSSRQQQNFSCSFLPNIWRFDHLLASYAGPNMPLNTRKLVQPYK